jgi:hypothetical protein
MNPTAIAQTTYVPGSTFDYGGCTSTLSNVAEVIDII